MPKSLFVSYSHKDELLYERLAKHLKPLEYEGLISSWYDGMILAGSEFHVAIRKELEAADIILLLISSDFIASNYCWRIETKRALERHDEGTARVVPIILRHVDWQRLPFGKLQTLPRDGIPVTSWEDTDRAFSSVSHSIGELIRDDATRSEDLAPGVDGSSPPSRGKPVLGGSRISITFLRHRLEGKSWATFEVLIDGLKQTELYNGEITELEIPAGLHSIRLRRLWVKSNEVSFLLGPTEHLRFECQARWWDSSSGLIERALSFSPGRAREMLSLKIKR